ncbi:nose resistant to fluoxetine protein 6-like [Pieris rapae]|uniref:nose resistant to fluoxetine protein 6-like n=1 Tax=Pieris rapae TaxID=64459 RepID=UPI001E27B25B|nr:nose resistant to fluoxetine protein 6-like [Pieris rapae]
MKVLVFVILLELCNGLYLNDTEYSRMPPVFQMDLYEDCTLKPNGTYCLVQFVLVSDTQSDLLDMINEYSSNQNTRYNHSLLRHGICVPEQCGNANKKDQVLSLEACLNDTYWQKYKLKTRVLQPLQCNTDVKDPIVFTAENIVVLVIIVVIIIMNIVGTLYHSCLINSKGNRFLMCFSIKQNLSKLRTSNTNLDNEKQQLKCFHGLRMLTILCVIYLHAMMITRIFPENPRFTEKMYDNVINYVIFNGTVLVQTFFIMAGFLLSYKLEKLSEKQKLTWHWIPKGILFTLLRLTPSYALILVFTITWLGYLGSGPYWQVAVMSEVEWCRESWLYNLFYLNNYVNPNRCMYHSWYVAANVQLMILGYFVCVLARGTSAKKWTIGILIVIGTIIPAAHTFYQDLDAVLFVSPELASTYFMNPTYVYVYTRAHNNIPDFVMGIALGYYTHYLEKEKVDLAKFQKYKFLFTLPLPMIIALLLIGFAFINGASVYARALYAGLIKPLYGVFLCMMIFGSIFKLENTWRPILEWNMWQVPSKLTYVVYLIHLTVTRFILGHNAMVYTNSLLNKALVAFGVAIAVFLLSIPLWVCFEGPIIELCKLPFAKKKEKIEVIDDNYTVKIEEATKNTSN